MKFQCEVQIFIIITQRTLKKDSISSRGDGVDDVHAIGAVTLAGVVVARIANADARTIHRVADEIAIATAAISSTTPRDER